MRMKKQILSGLLVLCMILALCPVIPFTAEAATSGKIPTIGKSGSLAGVDADATNITYLSDHFDDKLVAYNHVNGTATKSVANGTYGGQLYVFINGGRKQISGHASTVGGVRVINGVSYNMNDIYLGYNGIKYEKGIGVHPDYNNKDRYLIFDVKGMGNRFYSVVGGTGAAITDPNAQTVYMDFEVWGSTASEYSDEAEFIKLSYTTGIRSYLTAEFNVDITGYNYIKLVYKLTDGYTDAGSCASAWGNACVYQVPVPETEPPTELPTNPPRPTDPLNPSDYAGKKVSILGDSISTYTNVSNNKAYNTTIGVNKGFYGDGMYDGFTRADTWWQQTIDLLGMELLVDNAWGGACILNARPEQDNVGANSVAYGDRCVNLHNDITGEKPDVILVFKGTNDFSYFPSTLGSADAIDYTTLITKNVDGTFNYATPTTTCEAYAIMLHKMQTAYPDAEIFCMTLMPRRGNLNQPTEFNASIKAIAQRFGCGVVDLGSIFSSDESEFDKYIADQKVHPNKAGMDLMTQAVVNSMLNKETPVYDVTYNYKNGVLDNNTHVTFGGNFQINITPAIVNGSLTDVKVTMGGVDITDQVYNNNFVNIPNVTGNIVISATSSSLTGKAPTATNIQYLSDLFATNVVDQLNNKVILDKEYSSNLYLFLEGKRWLIAGNAATDEAGNRTFTLSDGSKVTFNKTDIALGYTAIKYNKGLGVHPTTGNAASRYIVYDVKDLGVDRFYAVVGATGNNPTNPATETHKITFELWGSTGETYNANDMVLLESISNLRSYLTGEFDVDISGYNYIKLVVRMADGCVDNQQSAAAWADACVYSSKPAHSHTPKAPVIENNVDATCGADGSYDEVVYCDVCGEEISRNTVPVPATGAHDWGNGVVQKEATPFATGLKIYTCSCGDTKEEVIEKAAYTSTLPSTTYQIGLIEPWFIKINCMPCKPGTTTRYDVNDLQTYGAFAIREGLLDEGVNGETLTVEQLINQTNVMHFSKEAGNIVPGTDGRLAFKYDDTLYTYRLHEKIYFVVYAQTSEGWVITEIRNRDLKDQMERNVNAGTFPVLEVDVFNSMLELYDKVSAFRAQYDNPGEGVPQNTATLATSPITFGPAATDGKYRIANSMAFYLIEPWGVKFLGRAAIGSNTSLTEDYSKFTDYGVLVYQDKAGALNGAPSSVLDITDTENVYVFSKSQGTMGVDAYDTTKMTATFNKDIFTYQMDTNVYFMYFVKDGDNFYYSRVFEINIMDEAAKNAANESLKEHERNVYPAMTGLYDAITAYREDYFNRHPEERPQ